MESRVLAAAVAPLAARTAGEGRWREIIRSNTQGSQSILLHAQRRMIHARSKSTRCSVAGTLFSSCLNPEFQHAGDDSGLLAAVSSPTLQDVAFLGWIGDASGIRPTDF